MAKGKKYYVVWSGRVRGVYEDWNACKEQVNGIEGAKYKSFPSKAEANEAFNDGYELYYQKHPVEKKKANFRFLSSEDEKPQLNSIAVDAAWNSVTKVMEYRGVNTATGQVLFHKGPFEGATNNIGEFLALVHGLAYLKKLNCNLPIYSDSITGIAWVRAKKHKSVLLPTEKNAIVFDLLERAEKWLQNNTYSNPIIKWNTEAWGEIPADFGRK
ncbi:MAG: ribonuclease H family protein [Bacteroidales bacterium]|nr:ribonuclease H family protein [Bacteroidales bacterium]